MFDYEDCRELAIDILEGTFARLINDPYYIGMAIGKAMAYWSEYLITYEEYNFYANAVYGYIYGRK